MRIFPLSWPGKVILILICIFIILIWTMFTWPDAWRKIMRGKKDEKKDTVVQKAATAPAKAKKARKGT